MLLPYHPLTLLTNDGEEEAKHERVRPQAKCIPQRIFAQFAQKAGQHFVTMSQFRAVFSWVSHSSPSA